MTVKTPNPWRWVRRLGDAFLGDAACRRLVHRVGPHQANHRRQARRTALQERAFRALGALGP